MCAKDTDSMNLNVKKKGSFGTGQKVKIKNITKLWNL